MIPVDKNGEKGAETSANLLSACFDTFEGASDSSIFHNKYSITVPGLVLLELWFPPGAHVKWSIFFRTDSRATGSSRRDAVPSRSKRSS